MRLVYYGTPSIAVPPLERLVEMGHAPLLVVTRRDRPRGRGLHAGPSPVRAAAERLGLPVATPERASAPEEVRRIRELAPDLLVLVAYGQILRPELLALPRIGALNLHFSLLPRHRGASPVQAAILSGDETTGVTTMWMTEGLDEGPTFLSETVAIEMGESAGALAARLAVVGARCLAESVRRAAEGRVLREPQDAARATYAPKIAASDAILSLTLHPADFARRVRAYTPEPGAYLPLVGGRLQVLAASPGEMVTTGSAPGCVRAVRRDRGLEVAVDGGTVWLERVKPGGRREMGGADYANGARLAPGSKLETGLPGA